MKTIIIAVRADDEEYEIAVQKINNQREKGSIVQPLLFNIILKWLLMLREGL